MRIFAVIAEFDPFHNGHLVPLAEGLKAGCTHSIAVMSGSWTQRGEPAMFSKYARAEAAVRCGYDLVLELPAPYALSSSERFAAGAVSLISSLGCVSALSFGSECGDPDLLLKTAQAMESQMVKKRIDELCRLGDSYPAARQKALEVFSPDLLPAIEYPNDILAVDYLRAILKAGGAIEPIVAKRRGVRHNSDIPSRNFASASYIRNAVRGGILPNGFMPNESMSVFMREMDFGRVSRGTEGLSSAIFSKLRLMDKSKFSEYPDCAGGLGDRIFSAAARASSVSDLYALAKSKNFAMTRVKRAIAAIMIGINAGINEKPVPYAHILAIGRNGDEVLSKISGSSSIPMSDSTKRLAGENEDCRMFAEIETRASELQAISMEEMPPKGSENDNRLYHV
ncbi:MAG: nucleotidyltransferase family protein [Oscillospiraceae bacterium]